MGENVLPPSFLELSAQNILNIVVFEFELRWGVHLHLTALDEITDHNTPGSLLSTRRLFLRSQQVSKTS